MAYERNDFGPRDDRWRDRDRSYGQGDDRGFLNRAGDEVRSWFGDEEAERRREVDARRYQREHGDRDFDDRWRADYGTGTGGGFGNQRGWNDDRFERSYGSEDRSRRSVDADRAHRGNERPTSGHGFEGDGDRGRRFEAGSGGERNLHDRHYSEWRQRHIDSLDQDYDDYRRENQSRFEQEFGSWREKRQGKRQFMNQINEHMEVIGSDDQHIGTVDHVRGDRILLTKDDASAGGRHHSIPVDWIDSVGDKVKIDKSADEAMRRWRDEERSRALFERDDQRQEGPHALERSFSGTYSNNR